MAAYTDEPLRKWHLTLQSALLASFNRAPNDGEATVDVFCRAMNVRSV